MGRSTAGLRRSSRPVRENMKFKAFAFWVLIVLLASLASAQHSPSLPGVVQSGSLVDWPQFHFDPGLSGYNPYETVLNPLNVGSVTMKWSYAPSEGNGVTGAPAVANGIMYFGIAYTGVSNGRDDRVPGPTWAVYALNAATGALLWKYETGPIFGSPAVANGVVYAIDPATVYALDANTGSLIWQYDLTSQSQYCSPTVVDNVLYFTSADGTVNALNATTGSHIWSYLTAGEILNAPAVANGVVYVTSGPGIVYALNAATGAVVWQKHFGVTIGPPRSLSGSLGGQAVANGVLYVGIQAEPSLYDLYALDTGTGAIVWRKAAATHYRETPAVANGIVYVVSDNLYALNAATGAVIWQTQSPGDSPTVANGVLYTAYLSLSAEGAVYGYLVAFDANTGSLVWQYKTGFGGFSSPMYPSPVAVNGMIYGSLIGPNQVGAFALPSH